MSIVVHKYMNEPIVLVKNYRKELPPYETRIKKAEANLVRRLKR